MNQNQDGKFWIQAALLLLACMTFYPELWWNNDTCRVLSKEGGSSALSGWEQEEGIRDEDWYGMVMESDPKDLIPRSALLDFLKKLFGMNKPKQDWSVTNVRSDEQGPNPWLGGYRRA